MIRTYLLVALFSVATVPAFSVETKVITDESFSNFNQGESTGTEVMAVGRLKIAPRMNRIDKTEEGVAWDVAVDPYDGNVFFCTGHNGKVYRYVPGGKIELWADLAEVEAISVAIDPTGGVLVGASPGGKIYRVVSAGSPKLYFETKEQYVWDMIFDRNGVLYAATGPNGKIFRIRGQNNGEVLYDSDATNIMALNFDSRGQLLAASQGKAFVFRVDGPNDAYVMYAGQDDEARTLTVDELGNIYVAINGSRSATFESDKDKDEKSGESIFGSGSSSARPTPTPTPKPEGSSSSSSSSGGGPSTVVQIQPSGFASNFWTAPEGPIQSVIADPFGTGLLVAAGKKGKIYHLNFDGNYSVIGDAEEPTVLAMARHDSKVYFTTANKAALYEMANAPTREGLFASRTFNAGGTVRWGNIYYNSEETSGTEVLFETRSGNTPEPDDKTWSRWISATRIAPKILRVESPVAQYLQYRLTMRATAAGQSPTVDKVQAFYIQQNAAPLIKSIEVDKVGGDSSRMAMLAAAARRASATPRPTPGSASSSGLPDAAGMASALLGMSGSSSSSRGYGSDPDSRDSGSGIGSPTNSQKVTISWHVTDPNGDKLRSKLSFKGEDEEAWKEIEKDLSTSSFGFSTEAIPDGKYRFKVEVTDSAENPETSASTVSLVSQVYVVDNSAPEITGLNGAKVGKDEYEISASASDATSIIAAAEYNIDASKEWRAAFPEDGIFDFNSETFRFRVKTEKESPEHTISLRVYDREGNSRVEKVLVK